MSAPAPHIPVLLDEVIHSLAITPGEIHVDGTFLTTRACMREMVKTGRGGAIILMGSVHNSIKQNFLLIWITTAPQNNSPH